MGSKDIPLPTMDFVEKKVKEIDGKKRFVLKDDDIDKVMVVFQDTLLQLLTVLVVLQIINEKKRFQKNPHNYALTKSRLMRDKVYMNTFCGLQFLK